MKRRNSLFRSSSNGLGDTEGVEIATEMAPSEGLQLSPELVIEHVIMSEYAMICRDPIDGLYAVPSARNKFEWFGLLFIRRGVYAGAVFRFILHLPLDFPCIKLPRVIFDLDVFHPHVNPVTRELDLKKYFIDGWKPDQHHIYHILLIVQRTFFTFDSNPETCANAEAATLLRDNRELYRKRASELIKKSRSVIYEPVDEDDANAIRLIPWDASIHEPLRQRLIGGLTDSQISNMSLLGSLGCGLSRSSLFESRTKHGFSWISPADLCYMVEPPRPAELDLKIISEAQNCQKDAALSHFACPGKINFPHISKLNLNDGSDFKQEDGDESQNEPEEKSIENFIIENSKNTNGLMEVKSKECEDKKLEICTTLFPELESAHKENEYVKTQLDDVPDTSANQALSGWNGDEVGESDI